MWDPIHHPLIPVQGNTILIIMMMSIVLYNNFKYMKDYKNDINTSYTVFITDKKKIPHTLY